ncbi:MAG TPA: sugar nucleotide-binding protein [Patescibacteria group bacterium]|nr:sugar nucleotide-binding protein [Patescibacteria group bacterium]
MQKKKVLILGASGGLGSVLMNEFFRAGYEVIGVDRKELDVTSQQVGEKVASLRPDIVINATGYTNVEQAEKPEEKDVLYQVNGEAPGRLAQAAKDIGAIFVHYSTDYVFSGENEAGYTEDAEPNPINEYGRSKYAGEKAVQAVGGQWYIIRASLIFGPTGRSAGSKQSLLASMMDLVLKKGKEKLQIEHGVVSSPTYSLDLASFTRRIVETKPPVGIYHGANTGSATRYEWIKKAFVFLDKKVDIEPVGPSFFPRVSARPQFSTLINTKLPPQRSWEEAVADYVKKYPFVDLSVITVNYRDLNILRQIPSVASSAERLTVEQIVVDNGSVDGSRDEIGRLFPQVKVIKLDQNLGFGRANNAALEIARGEYYLFLNPDMLVLPGSLDKAVEWMRQHPEVGILGAKLLNADGTVNSEARPRRFPTFFDQVIILLKLNHLAGFLLRRYLYQGFVDEKEQRVDSVRGAFMLVRRELVERLGWAFDPRYFLWFEDVDICRECWDKGWEVAYVPTVTCVDLMSQTFKKMPSVAKQVWFTQSMIQYFRKWHSLSAWLLLSLLRPWAIFLTWLSVKIKK